MCASRDHVQESNLKDCLDVPAVMLKVSLQKNALNHMILRNIVSPQFVIQHTTLARQVSGAFMLKVSLQKVLNTILNSMVAQKIN